MFLSLCFGESIRFDGESAEYLKYRIRKYFFYESEPWSAVNPLNKVSTAMIFSDAHAVL